jgi:hypothetical protein
MRVKAAATGTGPAASGSGTPPVGETVPAGQAGAVTAAPEDTAAAEAGESGVNSGALIDADLYFGIQIDIVRRKKELASLGKYNLDIVTPPNGARWGQFNDRRVDTAWVLKLFHEFQGVLDNCIDATTIDVVVKRRWVGNLPKTFDERLQRVESVAKEKVPLVEFTPEGIVEMPVEGLWMMGGNHRREALKLYVEDLEKKLDDAKDQASRFRKEGNDEGGDIIALSAEAERAQLIAQEYEKKIARSRLWVVNLYDKGMR